MVSWSGCPAIKLLAKWLEHLFHDWRVVGLIPSVCRKRLVHLHFLHSHILDQFDPTHYQELLTHFTFINIFATSPLRNLWYYTIFDYKLIKWILQRETTAMRDQSLMRDYRCSNIALHLHTSGPAMKEHPSNKTTFCGPTMWSLIAGFTVHVFAIFIMYYQFYEYSEYL